MARIPIEAIDVESINKIKLFGVWFTIEEVRAFMDNLNELLERRGW